MGLKSNSSFHSPNYFHRLSKALEFAVSEWLLMFLLLVDVCFTYLIAKFASYCKLQDPCVLCSRYDHVLAKNKTGIYWDSICNHHKSEISNLVLSNVSESLTTNGELSKNEKNIFVDKSLKSCESQKDDANTGSELEHSVSNTVVQLKSDSHFDFSGIHNDPAIVEPRVIDENKCLIDENKEEISRVVEPISFDLVSSSNNAKNPADVILETINPPKTNEAIKDPITANGHQLPNQLELGDAYKLAISTKGRQHSGKFLDNISSFNNSSTRISEELKTLLSHRSNDNLISPKLSFNSDELTGFQFLQSRISLERNESNISIDGSVVSEIEGESEVDRLRRQVEHDKKLMGVLYKELEEERNASAVAANQSMAMITRLQEEKAALYTEALQSLRMMEEQAEYDNEALQKANDVIEEKDKQIQDLEELLRKSSEDVRE